jgi:hypothetical protein
VHVSVGDRVVFPQADVEVETEVAAGAQPKKRTFRKYSYRGVDLDALLDMSTDDLVQLFPARARRRCCVAAHTSRICDEIVPVI